MDIGARLKLIRTKNKLTLEEAAIIFSITPQTLSRYENGKRTPDNTFLEAFGRHFNLYGDWLLYDEPPIYKAKDAQGKDLKEAFLELSRLIRKGDFNRNPIPDMIRIPIEKFQEDTPENFLAMLGYMLEDGEVRKNMFQFFFLFQKPQADKRRESSGSDYY